jgi:hypothetical protein
MIIYTMHFGLDLKAYLPFIDVINLWIWRSIDLVHLDDYIDQCRQLFPNKPINLGLYLHDYGYTLDTLPLERVQFQFNKAREYLKTGKIEGMSILGSYLKTELKTEQAKWIAECVANTGS